METSDCKDESELNMHKTLYNELPVEKETKTSTVENEGKPFS